MLKKYREWKSIQSIKNPRRIILVNIIILNIAMIVIGSVVIKGMSLQGTENMPFLQAVFCTISMMLDPGCISFVVEDVGESGVILAMICFAVVIFGMISFTGSVIGYVTNYISSVIEESSSVSKVLSCSDHMILLNWNSRGAEIINDMLYAEGRHTIVILVSEGKERIEQIIHEKIAATLQREAEMEAKAGNRRQLRSNLTVIVREGDVYSRKQLIDISIDKARTIIILGDEDTHAAQAVLSQKRGNVHTVKTLMQIADLTNADTSADDQNIIVEVCDPWTMKQVQQIIDFKQVDGKCNITPINTGKILGQILSQFTVLPELNEVYDELFSNFGADLYSEPLNTEEGADIDTDAYLSNHCYAIPLGKTEGENTECYFMAGAQKDIHRTCRPAAPAKPVEINRSAVYAKRTVIVIGRNSKYAELMDGYQSYLDEWPGSAEVILLDSEERLAAAAGYQQYPFVSDMIPIDLYDSAAIPKALAEILAAKTDDISILILSDDLVEDDDIDADALSNLVFVQTEINRYRRAHPHESRRIDVIVELVDPKHHDIVTSYNVDNVVISNRYISKLVTQIGENETLYRFFDDILTYDQSNTSEYTSKEIYVRRADAFFRTIPQTMTAYELVRAVAAAPENTNHTMLLGYIRNNAKTQLFSGNLTEQTVTLQKDDKLVLFSTHI